MTAPSGAKVFIDGQVVDPENAKISVFDRGFLYGDSVYETLRVFSGVPFAMNEHLDRFRGSGERIGFTLPWPDTEITDAVRKTLQAAPFQDASLRIVATRGSGLLGLDPSLAQDPKLIVMVLPLPKLPPQIYSEGRTAVLVSVRRNLKKAVDPQAKTGNYMNSLMAQREAGMEGADEAIMLDHEGRVTEAPTANLFAWVDDGWRTPPLEVGVLGGITRATILSVARAHHLPCAEQVLWPQDLARAEEIMLCSSVRELIPVVRLDGKAVGAGNVGPRYQSIRKLYQDHVAQKVQAEMHLWQGDGGAH